VTENTDKEICGKKRIRFKNQEQESPINSSSPIKILTNNKQRRRYSGAEVMKFSSSIEEDREQFLQSLDPTSDDVEDNLPTHQNNQIQK